MKDYQLKFLFSCTHAPSSSSEYSKAFNFLFPPFVVTTTTTTTIFSIHIYILDHERQGHRDLRACLRGTRRAAAPPLLLVQRALSQSLPSRGYIFFFFAFAFAFVSWRWRWRWRWCWCWWRSKGWPGARAVLAVVTAEWRVGGASAAFGAAGEYRTCRDSTYEWSRCMLHASNRMGINDIVRYTSHISRWNHDVDEQTRFL